VPTGNEIEVALVLGDGQELVLEAEERDEFFVRYPDLHLQARKGRGMWGARRLLVFEAHVVRDALEAIPRLQGLAAHPG
jgi:hypothetical protein